MLNLTSEAVVLIAKSGETTRFEPSMYRARVQSTRHHVDNLQKTPGALLQCDDDIPIYEETSEEVEIEESPIPVPVALPEWMEALRPGMLLLVTREVAEAAARETETPCANSACADRALGWHTHGCKPHPLSARMVFVADPVEGDVRHEHSDQTVQGEFASFWTTTGVIGYRALQRVAQ